MRPDPADLLPGAHAVECVGRHCTDCGACLLEVPPQWCKAPTCNECWRDRRAKKAANEPQK
jgi:hypothetical protein